MADEQGPWTTRRLLRWTTTYLERHQVDQPRLSAEMLLAHVLGVPRLKLYMDPDRPADESERQRFRHLVGQAARHAPIDYLIGQAPFFSLLLRVTPAVLIPRPSTETVVEHILQRHRRRPLPPGACLCDLATGSGAIAIALARHLPHCRVVATDLSPDALAVARDNAREQGVADRIDFRQGDLLQPLRGERFACLAGNPPYISDAEWEQVPANVKDYEPTLALRGGRDGLDLIRPLIAQAQDVLEPHGQLVLEIAASQRDAVLALAQQAGWSNPVVLTDHESLPRVLVADRPDLP